MNQFYYGSSLQDHPKILQAPAVYYCLINDAIIVGGNSFVLSKQYCLYDVYFQENKHNYLLIHGSVSAIKDNEIEIRTLNHRKRIKKGITLVGHAANNYYHFTIDLLARLYYIDGLNKYLDYPLLIDEAACDYYTQLIDLVNVHKRKIIPIKRDTNYVVENLIYPSFVSWNPIYRITSLNENAGNFYAQKPYRIYQQLKDHLVNNIHVYRKVFIYRKDVIRNDLLNEEAVMKCFSDYGYEVVVPTSMKMLEQIKLFASISVLAGAEGAVFSNMVYMATNTKVICITPKAKNKYMVSSLANVLGIDCIYLDAKLVKNNQHYLDLNYLKTFLVSEVKAVS